MFEAWEIRWMKSHYNFKCVASTFSQIFLDESISDKQLHVDNFKTVAPASFLASEGQKPEEAR